MLNIVHVMTDIQQSWLAASKLASLYPSGCSLQLPARLRFGSDAVSDRKGIAGPPVALDPRAMRFGANQGQTPVGSKEAVSTSLDRSAMDFVGYDRSLAITKQEVWSRSRGLTVSGGLQSNAADGPGHIAAVCLARSVLPTWRAPSNATTDTSDRPVVMAVKKSGRAIKRCKSFT